MVAIMALSGREWMRRGLCASGAYDPDMFFDALREELACRVCDKCPVRDRCLQYAVEEHESYGVWGGKTPAERVTLTRRWRMVREGRARRAYHG